MKSYFQRLCLITAVACLPPAAFASQNVDSRETVVAQLRQAAKTLQPSPYFPQLSPDSFLCQLGHRVQNPYELNQGRTVFCWLAAPLAYFYHTDPQGMAAGVINLYVTGRFRYFSNNVYLEFAPSQAVREAVGSAVFNGAEELRGRMVDQMVFLAFADHYKCWINIDRRFDPGDQNKSAWGGGTLGKEARLWEQFGYGVQKHGWDLAWLKARKAELAKSALSGSETIVMYVNAPHFNQNLQKIRTIWRRPPFFRTGTHYVLVSSLEDAGSGYRVSFWDDDGVQHYNMPDRLFQKSVYGILKLEKPEP